MVRACLVLVMACGLAAACSASRHVSEPVTVKRVQMHMGTLITITAVAQDESVAQDAVAAGFKEVRRLEALLSTWIPDSELSRVNRAAGQEAVRVSADSLTVVKRSLAIAAMTNGGFNIAVGPAVEAWSVMDRQRIPDDEELRSLHPLTDWAAVRVDDRSSTVFLPRAGMRIDVGGIGKGYAADRVVEVMRRAGAAAGVVALSGDIKAFGELPGGSGFPVGIRHPRQEDRVLTVIHLKDEAISTAGDYERFFERDGVRYHHILDPVTLKPARGCQSVTVIAREGTMADGLDTGIFVLGPERGMALVEKLPGVEAIVVDQEGRVLISSGLQGRLQGL